MPILLQYLCVICFQSPFLSILPKSKMKQEEIWFCFDLKGMEQKPTVILLCFRLDVWALNLYWVNTIPDQIYSSLNQSVFSPSSIMKEEINTVWILMHVSYHGSSHSWYFVFFQRICPSWVNILISYLFRCHFVLTFRHQHRKWGFSQSRCSFLIYKYWWVPSIILTCRPPL